MAKLKLKTMRADINLKKTIRECHEEYMDYCKSIGQREGTLKSKEKFFKYELVLIANLDDSINILTKDKIQKHINYMIDIRI
jgi:integrase/recombinase XerD